MNHLMLLMLPIIEGAALSPAPSLRASSLLLHKYIEAMDPLGIDERMARLRRALKQSVPTERVTAYDYETKMKTWKVSIC